MTRIRSGSFLRLVAVAVGVASVTLLGVPGAHAGGPEEGLPQLSETTASTIPPPASWAPGAPEGKDYDPWETFNERTFWFNHDVLDRYALKPAATVWQKIMPGSVRRSLANAFDNLAMPRRLVNNELQGRAYGANREVARFLLNTTLGLAGLFDVATRMGLKKSDADTGQTLGIYGVGPGPYVVVPFLPPLTVRDGIGFAVDALLDPLSYVAPFVANAGRTAGKTVNERAANLQLYQDVEDISLDLYSAVRNGYLQRRQKSIEDAIEDRGL